MFPVSSRTSDRSLPAFSPRFFEWSAPLPPSTAKNTAKHSPSSPVYYNPVTDADLNQFISSPKFLLLQQQYNVLLNCILTFYQHYRPQDKETIKHFEVFRLRLFDLTHASFYDTQRALLYNYGKDAFEIISRAVQQEKIPIEKRLTEIYTLGQNITVCAGGALSHLQDVAYHLSLAEGGLAAHLMDVKTTLLDHLITAFVQQCHCPHFSAYQNNWIRFNEDYQVYVSDEIHYVNAYRKHLQKRWGIPLPIDPFAVHANIIEKQECENFVFRRLTPQYLVNYMASCYLQDIQERFHHYCPPCLQLIRLDSNAYQQFAESLQAYEISYAERYGGSLPWHSLLILDQNGEAIKRLARDTTLIELIIIERLKQEGFIQYTIDPQPLMLLGTVAVEQQGRIMFLPGTHLYWVDYLNEQKTLLDITLISHLNPAYIPHNERHSMAEQAIRNSLPDELMALAPDNWLIANYPASFYQTIGV